MGLCPLVGQRGSESQKPPRDGIKGSAKCVIESRLGIELLPGKPQVQSEKLGVFVRILIRRGKPKRGVARSPDHRRRAGPWRTRHCTRRR